MRQIICVLLLGCAAAENVTWMKLKGLDCYIGHGATQIDDYPIGTLPLSACKQACADTPECTGIVVTPQDGQCWRRKDINISKCSTEFAQFDTWLKYNGTSGSILQRELQDMLNHLTSTHSFLGIFGLQLGFKNADESFTIASGWATNPEANNHRAITPDDTFNYGSGTKATIATAVMRMADAGKFNLSDNVSTYVDPFMMRNNGTTLEELYGSEMAGATILQVLRMEAGIQDFEGNAEASSIDTNALNSHGQVFPPYAWIRASASNKRICSPGSCSAYSSASYEVAGLLLAAVQNPDGDWDDFDLRKALIGDSDGKYPSMKLPGSQGKLKDTMSVAGFTEADRASKWQQVTLWDQNPTIMGWSCGGLNAKTGDVAEFFYDLLDESSPNPLVSAAARKEMTNIKPLTAGDFSIDYGAGLMDSAAPTYNIPTTKGPDDWGYIVGHIGSTFAFHAVNGYMPKAKAAISIVTNIDAAVYIVDIAACKAAEIAAKVLHGKTVDLGCLGDHRHRHGVASPTLWGRRHASPSVHRAREAGNVIV